MTQLEVKFILYMLSALLAVLAFIGSLAVNALIKMSNDIHEIKTTIATSEVKHDNLERRVSKLEIIME